MTTMHVSPAERRVLDALLTHGKDKLAARALGISHRCVELHLYRVRRRLRDSGVIGNPRPRMVLMRWWLEQREALQ